MSAKGKPRERKGTMKAEVKALWLSALRSGDYQQTTGKLHRVAIEAGTVTGDVTPAGFCCLGVLCDVAVKNGLDLEVEIDPGGWVEYNGQADTLPLAVTDWAGLEMDNPMVDNPGNSHGGDRDQLATLNDDYHWDFGEIANAIETSL
jgi:hypothetical protein